MSKQQTAVCQDLSWLAPKPEKARFAMVTPEMLDQLSAAQLKFWCRLRTSRLMNYQMSKGSFYASVEDIAAATGYSRAQSFRMVSELEDSGWLQVKRRGVPHPAGGLSNVYVLSLSAEAARKALTRQSHT